MKGIEMKMNDKEMMTFIMEAIRQAMDESETYKDDNIINASLAFSYCILVNPHTFNQGLVMLKKAGKIKLKGIRDESDIVVDILIKVVDWD